MRFIGFAMAAAAASFAAAAGAGELGAVDKPIKLALRDWSGQHVTTYIAGGMLEAAGYKVEYVEAVAEDRYAPVASGEVHAALENWATDEGETWTSALASGMEVLGDLGLEAREGIVYPSYVSQQCPGLPAWEALRDCAALFAADETGGQGRILDYPASWGTPGADRVAAMELPFVAVPAETEAQMIEEMRAAVKAKKPFAAFFWQPHWAMSSYALQFVQFPPYEEACMTDPAWGPNPAATGDCDLPRGGVLNVAWDGLKDTWPAAHEILSNFQLSIWDQQPLLALMDVKGEDPRNAAIGWLMVNKGKWRHIVDAATGKGGA